MFSLFFNIRTGRRGQLASLLTVFLVVFIIFAFFSVNLGRLALYRTRASNAADAAALAAGSSASRLLNYMAAFNDLMALNFSGMAFMLIPAFGILLWDIVRIFTGNTYYGGLIYTFNSIFWGDASNTSELCADLTALVTIIAIDTDTIALLVAGAKKVGGTLSERIVGTDPDDPGMNMMLSESTRNTARQYAFINAGIDEPKEDYDDWAAGSNAEDVDKDGDVDWDDYIRQESDFGAFMRTLPNTNDKDHPNYDPDFSADNLISFPWDDQRGGRKVNNRVDVYTTPIQPLDLTVYSFKDVATNSRLRRMLKEAINNSDSSWMMSQLFKMGITMSPLTYVLLEVIRVIILIVAVLIIILGIIAFILGIVYGILYAISCIHGCNYLFLESSISGFTYAAFSAVWYGMFYPAINALDDMDPSDVLAIVVGDEDNDLTTQVKVYRTTTPEDGPDSLDYDFWTMRYPQVRSGSRVLVKGSGGGLLIPPVTDYSPVIQKAW